MIRKNKKGKREGHHLTWWQSPLSWLSLCCLTKQQIQNTALCVAFCHGPENMSIRLFQTQYLLSMSNYLIATFTLFCRHRVHHRWVEKEEHIQRTLPFSPLDPGNPGAPLPGIPVRGGREAVFIFPKRANLQVQYKAVPMPCTICRTQKLVNCTMGVKLYSYSCPKIPLTG